LRKLFPRKKEKNTQLELRNGGLAAEVKDAQDRHRRGRERARYELGMVKKDEVFYQVVDDKAKPKR